MLIRLLTTVALFCSSFAASAETCDVIRSQINAKIRASGVTRFTLATVDASTKVEGKVVGTCDLGTKKIIYAQADAPAPLSATPQLAASTARPTPNSSNELILTECKDGYVSAAGGCKKK